MPLTINGRAVTARKGELVIDAAQDAGEYIPRFCYHERMSSVGMCRMCLVEIDTGRGPDAAAVVHGHRSRRTWWSTPRRRRQSRRRRACIELLLANHPLDCPVCDKGGECPLQDQAFSHGPGESRYVEEKRHFEKPIPISDLVFLDRERCILCDRCTRFADEVAGDPLIHFTQRGNETQITTFPDEPFACYFSGNTVQICPVGALTAKPYRFKARPWDLEQTESTCTTCAVGCRIVVQSSRDELSRYQGVDSDPVNWGWLCDRGRFNFEAVNSAERLTRAAGAQSTASLDRRDDVERRARPRRRAARATASTREVPARSPSSAAPAAPTKTPTRGPGWPTSSARRRRRPDGRRPARRACSASAGDDRRGRRGGDDHPARARPEGGAAGPVPAAARRRREAHAVASSSSPGSAPG